MGNLYLYILHMTCFANHQQHEVGAYENGTLATMCGNF